MYRPKGWETIPSWSRICDGRPITSTHEAFELGADAMLEGLIKKGCNFTRHPIKIMGDEDKPAGLMWMPAGKVNQRGKLVFIPEEDGCTK